MRLRVPASRHGALHRDGSLRVPKLRAGPEQLQQEVEDLEPSSLKRILPLKGLQQRSNSFNLQEQLNELLRNEDVAQVAG
jgi:hypothetical protein